MKMHGQFIRADGLIIPNNIMTYGIQSILSWAMQGVAPTLYMGLADCNPDPDLLIEDLNEPTLGLNGYARQSIAQSAVGWPTAGTLNGEPYIESKEFVFAASGGAFSSAIQRLALINSAAATSGLLVVALSGPLPAAITIDESTDVGDRTFKYRLYAR